MQKKKSQRRTTKRRTTRKSNSFTPPKAGAGFQKLVAVMSRLRAPKGCPWDREQTHATLRTYLIEEAYEVLDALDSTDDAKFAEELGDLLLQVLFHAQIAHEEGRFDVRDVIREIYEKMIRRHPHVFGSARAKTAADVLRNWERIKMQERQRKSLSTTGASPNLVSTSPDSAESASVLDGVPRTLPALLEALQLTRKAARIGFDWSSVEGIFDKLTEETHELQTVLASQSQNSSRIEGELGDLLFVTVNLARFLHIDPEIALKKTCGKFARRFRTMERLARDQGTTLPKVPRPQMEAYWDQAKQLEQSSSEN